MGICAFADLALGLVEYAVRLVEDEEGLNTKELWRFFR